MAKSYKDVLNDCSPSQLADLLRALGFGSLIRKTKVDIRGAVPAADAAQLATVLQVGLPDDCRAGMVTRAYARAGGVTGELTAVAPNTTPTTGQYAISPNGDIVTLATDAITSMDVEYIPSGGDVVTLTGFPVVPGTGVLALPPAVTNKLAIYLIDANVTAGTLTGRKHILAPAAGAPATTNARLDVAKSNVQFAVADAVTQATVRLLVGPSIDPNKLLEATSDII